MNDKITRSRPFLKWAGNKYRCLEHIQSSFSDANRLIEPFAGSAAIFLNTHYQENILAESNLDLVNLYQQVKCNGQEFIDFSKSFFISKNNIKSRYIELREQFNHMDFNVERAALFLYLNRHGFNGLCRYNSKGVYNVPFGSYQKPYFPEKEMHYFHQKSQDAEIIHSDFRDTFKHARKGDLIYCDPPYVGLTKTADFTQYTGAGFCNQAQQELVACAKEARQQGVMVIISNHDTPFTREIYKEANIKNFLVSRSISCMGHKRQPSPELLAIFHPEDQEQ